MISMAQARDEGFNITLETRKTFALSDAKYARYPVNPNLFTLSSEECTYDPVDATTPSACMLEDTPLIDFSGETAKCCVTWTKTGGSASIRGEIMAFAYHPPTPRQLGKQWCDPGSRPFDCSYCDPKTELPEWMAFDPHETAFTFVDEYLQAGIVTCLKVAAIY